MFSLALNTPAAFVLAWIADGAQTAAETSRATGGTGTAIRLDRASGIRVVSIARDGWADALDELLQQAAPVASSVPSGECSFR